MNQDNPRHYRVAGTAAEIAEQRGHHELAAELRALPERRAAVVQYMLDWHKLV